jgi:hypothetical protein
MRKTIILIFLIGFVAFLATETKAQQPVSQSERRTVIKALETKIAELEVKRAVDLPKYAPDMIDQQLVNLRERLAQLIGMRRSVTRKHNPNSNALIQKRHKSKAQN